MDVDREDDLEDELSVTSGGQTLRRSAALRAFRDSSRRRAARQQPFQMQSTPKPEDDLRKKADRILRFLEYFSQDFQETKDALTCHFRRCLTLAKDLLMN